MCIFLKAIDHTFYGFTGVITQRDVGRTRENCTQLYLIESIRKKFVLTDGTGSFCNRGLHQLFTSCSGLRSVFWTLS